MNTWDPGHYPQAPHQATFPPKGGHEACSKSDPCPFLTQPSGTLMVAVGRQLWAVKSGLGAGLGPRWPGLGPKSREHLGRVPLLV